jgi:RsiW-degrading membrane proteinase PrsW (M82 family)
MTTITKDKILKYVNPILGILIFIFPYLAAGEALSHHIVNSPIFWIFLTFLLGTLFLIVTIIFISVFIMVTVEVTK